MSSTKVRIPLDRALFFAHRFKKLLEPHCDKVVIAGSCRRMCADVGDIEIVCVPKEGFDWKELFPADYEGLVVDGERLKRFKYPDYNLQIELYITNIIDFGRILAIRTGSAAYSRGRLAIRWNRLGWCGTSEGLRRKAECVKKSVWKLKPEYADDPTLPPAFETEESFFEFLGIPWEEPAKRNWTDKNGKTGY